VRYHVGGDVEEWECVIVSSKGVIGLGEDGGDNLRDVVSAF
jgi:hypothetical protein